jgi:hypothetical protein
LELLNYHGFRDSIEGFKPDREKLESQDHIEIKIFSSVSHPGAAISGTSDLGSRSRGKSCPSVLISPIVENRQQISYCSTLERILNSPKWLKLDKNMSLLDFAEAALQSRFINHDLNHSI